MSSRPSSVYGFLVAVKISPWIDVCMSGAQAIGVTCWSLSFSPTFLAASSVSSQVAGRSL
jgi:hypothetical protein